MSKESLVFSEVFRELDHLVVSIMIPPLSLHSFLFFSKFGYKCGIVARNSEVHAELNVWNWTCVWDRYLRNSTRERINRMWEIGCGKLAYLRFSSLSLSTLQFFLQPSSAQLSILVASYIYGVPRRKSWRNIKNTAKMAKSDPVGSFQHNHIKKAIDSRGKSIVSSLIFPAGYKIMDRHSDSENWSQCPKTQKCANMYGNSAFWAIFYSISIDFKSSLA